jgi:O-antigen/teichoic acid export membrane protein
VTLLALIAADQVEVEPATASPTRRFTARLRRSVPSRDQWRVLASGSGLMGRFGYLVATQTIVMVLGVAYWAITARLVPAASVGISAAAVSAAAFLSAVGVLGIGSLLLVEVHRVPEGHRRVVVSTGVAVVGVVVLSLALVAWAVSPYLGHSLAALGSHPEDALLFVAGSVVTAIAAVFDATAIGLRKSPVQLVRNVVSSSLRLALLVTFVGLGTRTTTGLLIAWSASTGASLVFCPRLLGLSRARSDPSAPAQRREIVRRFARPALRHHALNLAITSVTFFLPVLAALFLVPAAYAYFSVAQLVSSTVLLLPALLAVSLFAEASGDPASLHRHVRRTLPIGFGCCLAAIAVVEPGAPLICGVFGRQYADHGTEVLRILICSGVPYVVKDHFVAIRRAQGRLTDAARVVILATCLEAVAAAVGAARAGVIGLSGFWVAATVVEAGIFVPVVWRVARQPRHRR